MQCQVAVPNTLEVIKNVRSFPRISFAAATYQIFLSDNCIFSLGCKIFVFYLPFAVYTYLPHIGPRNSTLLERRREKVTADTFFWLL